MWPAVPPKSLRGCLSSEGFCPSSKHIGENSWLWERGTGLFFHSSYRLSRCSEQRSLWYPWGSEKPQQIPSSWVSWRSRGRSPCPHSCPWLHVPLSQVSNAKGGRASLGRALRQRSLPPLATSPQPSPKRTGTRSPPRRRAALQPMAGAPCPRPASAGRPDGTGLQHGHQQTAGQTLGTTTWVRHSEPRLHLRLQEGKAKLSRSKQRGNKRWQVTRVCLSRDFSRTFTKPRRHCGHGTHPAESHLGSAALAPRQLGAAWYVPSRRFNPALSRAVGDGSASERRRRRRRAGCPAAAGSAPRGTGNSF